MYDRHDDSGTSAGAPLADFSQEFFWWNVERVLLKYAADNYQGMRAHDINHITPPELRKMIDADNRIVVLSPNIINPRFEFNHVIDARLITHCPVYSADNAAQGKPSIRVSTCQAFENRQHPVLIELPVP